MSEISEAMAKELIGKGDLYGPTEDDEYTRQAEANFARAQASAEAPERCPMCGDSNSVEIVYGMPDAELSATAAKGLVELGGCSIVQGDPDTHCRGCGHNWLAEGDPAQGG